MELEKEKNFVSAVVYIHNDEQFIDEFQEKLSSLFEEKFENWEIIFVNDKSTDSSVAKIKSKAADMTKSGVVSILNMSYYQGLEASMNAGVNLAIGDFVFEFDSVFVDYDISFVMDVYKKSLEGFDIVATRPIGKKRISSKLFYIVINRFSNLQYPLDTEKFRLLSRRAINRVHSLSKTIPYRKALYANSGLKNCSIEYKPHNKNRQKKSKGRMNLAVDSLLLFTDVAYRGAFVLSVFMVIIMIVVALYALIIKFLGNPANGWTSTILFLSFAFFGLFAILGVIIKYLSMLIHLTFNKTEYLFESIEKI